MADAQTTARRQEPERSTVLGSTPRIPVLAFGLSLSTFFAIAYILCVGFDLLFPDLAMYRTWLRLFPGVSWLSLPDFLLGLVEAFTYGWYVALVFASLFNAFSKRWQR